MTTPFQPFLDQLAHDLQGVLPPEEVQATVADARAHLHDLQSRLLAEGMPPDLAAQQALLEFGPPAKITTQYNRNPWKLKVADDERWAVFFFFAPVLVTFALAALNNLKLALDGSLGVTVGWTVLTVTVPIGIVLSSMKCRRVLAGHILTATLAAFLAFTLTYAPSYAPGPDGSPISRANANDAIATIRQTGKPVVYERTSTTPHSAWIYYPGQENQKFSPDSKLAVHFDEPQIRAVIRQPLFAGLPATVRMFLPDFVTFLIELMALHLFGLLLGFANRRLKMRRNQNQRVLQ